MVRAGADFSQISREMARTQRTLNTFQSNVSKTMKMVGIALGGLAIGKLVKDSLNAASELEGAFVGLESILNGQGRSFGKAKSFIDEYVKDGLIPLTDAITAYKNLAARGYDDKQIQVTMERLKDAASFGRQSSYTLGEAVKTATEGLKNENSILVDNAGVTKNVAKMWDDYAKTIGKNRNQLTQQEKIQAEVNGIMQETQWQVGDAAKYADTYAGRLAALTKTLKDIKVNLGNAFMPIANVVLPLLQSLANALAEVTNTFAQFSQALFGKAKTQAKATQEQANSVSDLGNATEKAGKQAKGALAGFDEVNNLGDSSGTGGASGGVNTEDMVENIEALDDGGIIGETSAKIEEMANKVRTAFDSIRENIIANKDLIIAALAGIGAGLLALLPTISYAKLAADQLGITFGVAFGKVLTAGIIGTTALIAGLVASFVYLYRTNEDFKNQMKKIWSETAQILTDFKNNTLKPMFDYIVNGFLVPIGNAFKENILPVLAEIFVGVGQILNDILNLLISTFDNIWNIIQPALELVKTIIIDALEIIKSLWDKYGQDLINNVRTLIQGLQDTFQLIWDNIINPIIQPALEMLTWLWSEHIKGLIEQVGEFVMKCVNGALELYNGFIKPIIDWIIVEFGPEIARGIAFVVNVFGSMVAGISDVIKGLFKILGGIVDFIVGVFTGNWKKAWEGVKDIFKGVFDSLFGIVKVPLNLIIDAINKVIEGLNGISVDVPKWVPIYGGKTWGFNIPSIPKLARGGIVDGPTVAMIGEAGKEMVVPLENTSFVDKLASALGTAVMGAMQFNNNQSSQGQNGDTILQIDGRTLAQALKPYIDKENQRIGGTIIQTT